MIASSKAKITVLRNVEGEDKQYHNMIPSEGYMYKENTIESQHDVCKVFSVNKLYFSWPNQPSSGLNLKLVWYSTVVNYAVFKTAEYRTNFKFKPKAALAS